MILIYTCIWFHVKQVMIKQEYMDWKTRWCFWGQWTVRIACPCLPIAMWATSLFFHGLKKKNLFAIYSTSTVNNDVISFNIEEEFWLRIAVFPQIMWGWSPGWGLCLWNERVKDAALQNEASVRLSVIHTSVCDVVHCSATSQSKAIQVLTWRTQMFSAELRGITV